jgi:hypothetical protein
VTPSEPSSLLLALAIGLGACSSAGERTAVVVPPPRPPTDREDVGRLVGTLLSADPRASREAEAILDRLDAPGRAALAEHARAIPTERDPRWLSVLDRNGLLGDAPPDARLDLLVWRAGRRDARSAREGREGLAAWAKSDPAPLLARLERSAPGRAALATALGEAERRDAVPALLALYREAESPEERKAASGALGAIAGESLRPRVDGTPEEIEADAARVEAWHATGADRVP